MVSAIETTGVKAKMELLLRMLNRKLNEKGFNIDLMSLSKDNVAILRPSGCEECAHAKAMVQYYLSKLIKKKVPEIKEVICI